MARVLGPDSLGMSTRTARSGAGAPAVAVPTTADSQLSATILAGLLAAGSILTLLVMVLPHPPAADQAGMLAVAAIGCVIAGGLAWRARRVGAPLLQAVLVCATTLGTAVAYFSAGRPGPFVLLYLWVAVYAAYFFSRRQLAAQLGYVALIYGAFLLVRPPPSGRVLGWWVAGVGTVVVAAAVIQVMRYRMEALITRLFEAARTDPLTGLGNRTGFREVLDLEVERARRGGGRLAVVLADIDEPRIVDDHEDGQPGGDAILRRIGTVLRSVKRQSDVAARVGAREFALVLPDTEADGALGFVERLREALAGEFAHDPLPVTLSFGVVSQPRHGQTAASLIRAGDEALSAAKLEGGDRAVLHRPELRGISRQRDGAADIEAERYVGVMLDLAETVDLRFSGTARHSETVGRYAEMMARELGLPEPRIERVRLAGALHDIGKVGVPDSILHKPAKLSDAEFATIRRHPELGAQILEHPSLADVREWVATHHERPDGRGYPFGLGAGKIALEAQIIAVADAYEAMTSDRAYRSAIGRDAARAELERCAGSQFDPHVVRAFLALLERDSQRANAALTNAA